MANREQIIKELDSKIPRDAISEREGGGGRSLSYLEGHYVIDRLNKVLGQGNWSYYIKDLRLVHTTELTVHYIAQLFFSFTIDGQTSSFEDVGYGDGKDKNNIGKAHELATKEAITDALKRCAKNLGMSMGLALYDKEQTNVEDTPAPKLRAIKNEETTIPNNTKSQIKVAASVLNARKKISLGDFKSRYISPTGKNSVDELTDEQAANILANVRNDFAELQLQ